MSQSIRTKVKTTHPTTKGLQREFYLLDASKKPIGRIATEAARILMGKHKAVYSPDVNMGSVVVIINSEKAILTGMKSKKKNYFRHTGRNLHIRSYEETLAANPAFPMYHAIKGMLPKNRMQDVRAHQLLHIFPGNHNLPNTMIEVL